MSVVTDWDAAVVALGVAKDSVEALFPYDYSDDTVAVDATLPGEVTTLVMARDAIVDTLAVLQSGQGEKAYAALVRRDL